MLEEAARAHGNRLFKREMQLISCASPVLHRGPASTFQSSDEPAMVPTPWFRTAKSWDHSQGLLQKDMEARRRSFDARELQVSSRTTLLAQHATPLLSRLSAFLVRSPLSGTTRAVGTWPSSSGTPTGGTFCSNSATPYSLDPAGRRCGWQAATLQSTSSCSALNRTSTSPAPALSPCSATFTVSTWPTRRP